MCGQEAGTVLPGGRRQDVSLLDAVWPRGALHVPRLSAPGETRGVEWTSFRAVPVEVYIPHNSHPRVSILPSVLVSLWRFVCFSKITACPGGHTIFPLPSAPAGASSSHQHHRHENRLISRGRHWPSPTDGDITQGDAPPFMNCVVTTAQLVDPTHLAPMRRAVSDEPQVGYPQAIPSPVSTRVPSGILSGLARSHGK